MDRKIIFLIFVILVSLLFWKSKPTPPKHTETPKPALTVVYTPKLAIQAYQKPLYVRVLILRHAREQMANDDANLVVNGVQRAAQKGLAIKIIGNQYVGSLSEFENAVTQSIKKESMYGDTLIVHTIGHGFGGNGGGLQSLGSRQSVMDVLVKLAAKNKQETLWWQLSCHAAAGLPNINSLTPQQQELFSDIASSNANQLSPSGVEGRIMERLFLALADKNSSLDANRDGIITAGELRKFLESSQRASLFFAKSESEIIFGSRRINFSIKDRNNPQKKYDPEYILWPKSVIFRIHSELFPEIQSGPIDEQSDKSFPHDF